MKHLFLACLFLLTPSLFALYNGNPDAPALIEEGFFFCKENWFSVKAGYQRDWVFDRNMKAVTQIKGHLTDFSYLADQGVLTFNLVDRIELYGSAGATRFSSSNIPFSETRNEYETHDQFSWGAGGRIIIFAWENLTLGANANYARAQPRLRWMTTNGASVTPLRGSKIKFQEWQIGLGFTYQIELFYPYITARYANATARFRHLPEDFLPNITHFKAKNRRKFGMSLGCSLSNTSRFDVTVEVRLIDEEAVTLAGEIKF